MRGGANSEDNNIFDISQLPDPVLIIEMLSSRFKAKLHSPSSKVKYTDWTLLLFFAKSNSLPDIFDSISDFDNPAVVVGFRLRADCFFRSSSLRSGFTARALSDFIAGIR